MIFLLYIIFGFISLFILYAVARHDFVLLRQSISLRQVFDNAFIGLFVFFFTSRIGYAFYELSFDLLNPLRFFYLTKYWGILPFTGFVGMMTVILILFRKKKNKLRILDIYFISFSPIILLDILTKGNTGVVFIIKLISVLVLVGFYGWFIKIHNKYTTKDGFVTCLSIITYALSSFALSVAAHGIFLPKILWFHLLIIVTILIAAVYLVLVQRDFFNKN